MGPTIQQGIIQRPVQQKEVIKRHKEVGQQRNVCQIGPALQGQGHKEGNTTSGPGGNGGGRVPAHDKNPEFYDYVMNYIHGNKLMCEVARPVFVNHYYAGEQLVPITRKRTIKLDECDVSTESSVRHLRLQAANQNLTELS